MKFITSVSSLLKEAAILSFEGSRASTERRRLFNAGGGAFRRCGQKIRSIISPPRRERVSY
jgi:hypothetical protein